MSSLDNMQPPLPLQAFKNLQAWSSVLQPPNPLQSFVPAQSRTTGMFLAGATLPGEMLVLEQSAQPCWMAVPLSNPAMAAATATFLDTFFIEKALSSPRIHGTFDFEREGESEGANAFKF